MVDFHHIEIEWTKLVDVAPAVLNVRPVSMDVIADSPRTTVTRLSTV
jgi:hypothetical protein